MVIKDFAHFLSYDELWQDTDQSGKKCLVLFLYKSAVTGGCCQNFQFDDDDDDDDDDENKFFLQNG